jgi:phospholipase/lecithinase/hemolysin
MDDAEMVKEAEEYPERFGLINIDQACYQGKALFHGGGTVCAEPDKYLFWDIVHPTTVGHAALADLALQTIRNTAQ